jgi:hypothetical protein
VRKSSKHDWHISNFDLGELFNMPIPTIEALRRSGALGPATPCGEISWNKARQVLAERGHVCRPRRPPTIRSSSCPCDYRDHGRPTHTRAEVNEISCGLIDRLIATMQTFATNERDLREQLRGGTRKPLITYADMLDRTVARLQKERDTLATENEDI